MSEVDVNTTCSSRHACKFAGPGAADGPRRGLDPDGVDRQRVFGISVCNLTFNELCSQLDSLIASRQGGYVVTPNVDHVCRVTWDESFREAYNDATLTLVDGTIVLWCARLLGVPVKEKLSGSDLVPKLSEFASHRGYSIYFLGAAEGVGAEAAQRLQERFPGFGIAGVYSPPMGFERDERACADILERLRGANADFCFVALGSPKQEVWMRRWSQVEGVPLLIGIGASLDFAAGRVRRAPYLFQICGLEWLWRLALEPRRLWRRYLVDDMKFVPIVMKEAWSRWWRKGGD